MSRRALALFVLLLLSVLSVPALAQTVSFRDERGAAATDFVVGELLRVRVVDPQRNVDPGGREYLAVNFVNTSSGYAEGTLLIETSYDTGVFEGFVASGALGVLPEDVVTATYEDLGQTSSTIQATMTASRTELVDSAGEPAAFYLESSRVHVRVFSPLVNNPQTVDTVAVTLTADLSGDEEPLLLNETGPDTGVFTGSFQLRLGPGLPASGALETTEDAGPPHRFDTVRAAHADGYAGSADAVETIGSLTRFVDAAGREVASYPMGSIAVVEVEDHNYNDPGQLDTVSVNLQSVSTGDQEPLPLRETGRDTGLYRSSILLDGDFPAIPADGQLRVQVGGDIDAMHFDFLGIVASGTRAAIDFLGIQFVDEAGFPTSEVLENGTARVRVFSAGDNVDPSIAETLSVEVTSLYAGDRDFVQLTETGLDTSVFEGTIELSFASGTQGNGILETLNSGPPEFRPEELTARLGPYTGTAHTIAARLAFLDELGRETATVPLGLPVRVRLTDHSRNDPGVLQTFQIDVQVANPNASGDGELVTLRETGFDTGVFEGQIASQAGSPQSNGRLDGALGFMIEANIFHLNDPGVIQARAVFTGSAVSFIDAEGQPTSVFLESSRAYVRVFDSFANGNPFGADTTVVEIAAELSGDRETVTLTETGANTGLFEGSIRLRFGAGQPFDGWLETSQEPGPPPITFDTLRAIYTTPGGTSTATATTLSSRTLFTDAFGKVVSSYARGATVYLRVEDANVNQHSGSFDLAEVTLRSESGDVELVQLVETGRNTSLFEGSIRLSDTGSSGDGELQAAVGSEIEAEHLNPHLGSSKAYAVIDSVGIEFIDEAGRPTSEVLENGTARLRVTSADANSDPGTADTLDVDVRSRFAGDREFAQLTETGADTGLFEGTIDLNFAPASQANGILETLSSGPPEFLPEELTARIGPYTATAHTVSARLVFIDEFGRETVTVPLGSAVRVRLADQTQNEPQQRQSVQMSIQVVIENGGGSTSFDNETITLRETGFDTGVFEGLIDSRAGSPQGNGVLNGATGSTIEVQVFHLNNPESTLARATFTGNAVLFIDEAGQPASVYLESSRVYVRLLDSFGNGNPSSADSTVVQITSEISGDQEPLSLIETGANTGVFEGSIKMRTGGGRQFSGFLETSQESGPPHQYDTLRATYNEPSGTSTATARTTGSLTWFVDAFGTVVDSYAKDSTAYVRVEDHNFNTDPGRFDTASVRLTSQSPGDEELLLLQETGKDTGTFEGSIRLASSGSGSDGRLQASLGSQIDVEH
ncbi:MAG TPA: hypothetical protein VNW71_25545, partial [Thermoanaerobaculia bacterium]|nr:hypothetical protein [Thermoanaerobaculia bacterium]